MGRDREEAVDPGRHVPGAAVLLRHGGGGGLAERAGAAHDERGEGQGVCVWVCVPYCHIGHIALIHFYGNQEHGCVQGCLILHLPTRSFAEREI